TVLGVFYLIIHLLTNSPYGRVLRAIREDEEAVQALGKNTTLFKVQAFALGSAMAGAAGSLYTQYLSYVGPDLFSPALTFTVWIMVLLGGPANNVGAVLGALIMQAFDRGTRILKDFLVLPVDPMNLRFIIIGILIILFLMYRPEGLLKEKDIRTVVG
ncbi:branched-chain amino acid ABC transporter permease, partial [Candidatus Bathyarchaeota archaeon]